MHAAGAIDQTTTPPEVPRDGRNLRKDRTRAALLTAARSMLVTGEFRPTMAAIAKAAGCSARAGFDVGGGIDKLLLLALDQPTRRAILTLVLRDSLSAISDADANRIVLAIVQGRG